HHVKTGLTGVVVGVDVNSLEKVWNTFQAIGNIAFAYAFSVDTLKSSPPENQAMKKSALTGVTVTTFFYALCGLLGYEAFGNKAPGNFLTGFGFYEPYWLVDIGNLFIIIHLVGAYQLDQFKESSQSLRFISPFKL
ncbi:amino acid permease 6-like protein, partial [Trifolium pratense]